VKVVAVDTSIVGEQSRVAQEESAVGVVRQPEGVEIAVSVR
jgi:hypothetical protein